VVIIVIAMLAGCLLPSLTQKVRAMVVGGEPLAENHLGEYHAHSPNLVQDQN
jgi:hypothetical protein